MSRLLYWSHGRMLFYLVSLIALFLFLSSKQYLVIKAESRCFIAIEPCLILEEEQVWSKLAMTQAKISLFCRFMVSFLTWLKVPYVISGLSTNIQFQLGTGSKLRGPSTGQKQNPLLGFAQNLPEEWIFPQTFCQMLRDGWRLLPFT